MSVSIKGFIAEANSKELFIPKKVNKLFVQAIGLLTMTEKLVHRDRVVLVSSPKH